MSASVSPHPTDQRLRSYRLGTLDEGAAAAIGAHLEQCPECRRRAVTASADHSPARNRDTGPRDVRIPGEPPPSTLAPAPVVALPPSPLDHPDYQIKKELGRGGMGVVYLAYNRLMGRDEVLKVMSRQIIAQPGALDRFLREIRAVARLRHPNIVTAYSAMRVGDSVVLAMEYVEGLDLARLVTAKGPLPVAHACLFVHQAALGLQHAHEQGLVHRDIKPGNLMLSRSGDRPVVKVLDFGLAKLTLEEKVDGSLTSQGQAIGTPDFIAPEQILNAPNVDSRADIYSLGGTLFFLLTGRPPFRGNSLYDIYQAHLSRDAERLNFVRPEVPAELAAVVARMLAKDPTRRVQAPKDVAQAVKPFFKSAGGAAGGSAAERSQPGETAARPQPIAARTVPSHPETAAARSDLPPTEPAEPTEPERLWVSLPGHDASQGASAVSRSGSVAATAPVRGRPWLVPALVAGALLAAMLAWRARSPGQANPGLPPKAVEGSSAVAGVPSRRASPIDTYAERIRAAQSAAAQADWPRALGTLDACAPDLRGWEWGFLRLACERRVAPDSPELARTARGPWIYFGALAVSPDGRRVAAACRRDRSVTVWEPDTGAVRRLSAAGREMIGCGVAFSADGRLAAVAGNDGITTIFNVGTGAVAHEFHDHNGCVNAVVFSPRGDRIASGGDDGMVIVRELDPSRPPLRLSHTRAVSDVAWHPGGQRIATACGDPNDRVIRIWGPHDGRLLNTLAGHEGVIGGLAFNAYGTRLASCDNATMILWDMDTNRKLRTIRLPDAPCDRPTFSPDGTRVAAALQNRTVRIWSEETGRELLTISGNVLYCGAVFSLDGRRLAASGKDRPVLVAWDAASPDSYRERSK